MSSGEGKKLSVPKFTSFKPKPELSQSQSKQHEFDELSPVRIGSRDPQEHPVRKDISRHQEPRHPWSAQRRHRHHESSNSPRPSDISAGDSFVIDGRGDALIRRYGSNNRYDVPSYRRFGSGRVLGADGFLMIERLGNHEEFSIRGFGEGSSALSRDRKSVLAKAGRRSQETVRVRKDKSGTFTGLEDFLPLRNTARRPSSRRKSYNLADKDQDKDETEPNYRDIHGKSKAHEHSDSDEVYESDSSVLSIGSSRNNDPAKEKTIELSTRVRDQSQNLSAWLELVDHQDTLLRLNHGDGQHITPAEVKSYADVKLSLLEKALTNFQGQDAREKLLLRIMHEGSKVWDPQRISNRWEDLMRDHGDSFEVWRGYVNFRQTSLSTFQYEEIKRLYISRLRKIEARLMAPAVPTHDLHALCDELVIVFLRMTRFISEAGFTELATAAWQSTLELCFCRPAEEVIGAVPTSFQDFWESEVPRIGEESALGWAAFDGERGNQEAPEPKTSNKITLPATRNPYKAWAVSEQHQAAEAMTPARTLDEGAEADPYRVVMYADIRELLSFVPSPMLPMIQMQLLDAFLIFNHLPPAFGTGNVIQIILQDTMLDVGDALNLEISQQTDQSSHDEPADTAPDLIHIGCHYQRIARSLETLFPSSRWFRYIQPTRKEMSSDQYNLILNTLRQLTHSFGQGALATYLLAFEAVNEEGGVKKAAKALMKRFPMNTELYVGYSGIESSKDNKASARKIISAALGLPGIAEHDKLSFCLSWAWMELADGNFPECVSRLCLLSEDAALQGTPASTAQLLKARQLLKFRRDYLISCGDANHGVIYTMALCLVAYTTGSSDKEPRSPQQGDISSALDVVSSTSGELTSHGLANSEDHERLLQFAARLLYFHATHGPFRPGLLHGEVAKYINYFPQNTIFLALYAWREARLSIEDRVRSILDDVVLVEPHDCVTSRVFAITHEMRAGNAHSTAAAFEHTLETEVCKHHFSLWIAYMRFCHSRRELKSKAKSVFYRSIQQCPWSKDAFMEAFVTLVSDMDSSELRSVYNTLCEKGLRVHVELEDFVQSWKQAQRETPRYR